jgi:hypothetical protein
VDVEALTVASCCAWPADMHMREVTICYGMTETSPVSFQSATDGGLLPRATHSTEFADALRFTRQPIG